jgi:hypothetical protein
MQHQEAELLSQHELLYPLITAHKHPENCGDGGSLILVVMRCENVM